MNFLFPGVLIGMAAVGIPVVIHMLNKFRVQRTQWAAMRFLQDTVQTNKRRLQIEDLLLLLLRCALVALLVLAFAQPVWERLIDGSGGSGGGPVTAVVLLDNSMSMSQSNGVETRFQLAKKEIQKWLESADPNSMAALYLVSDRAVPMVARPSNDFTLLRRNVELAEVSERGSDLCEGLRAAYQALRSFTANRCEIIIYTDSQTPAWARLDEMRKLQAANPHVKVRPVVLGAGGEANLAITDLRPEGGVPAVNQPCRLQIAVSNYGTATVEGVRVTISIDGNPPSDETVLPKIEPGATVSVNLFAHFVTAGYHSVTASIPPDRLARDNTRVTAVQVVDHVRVLIGEGSPEKQPVDQDGYFLANALAPISSDRMGRYYLQTTSIAMAEVGKKALDTYDLVFLCNPGVLPEATVKALSTYVQQGGSLVIFPGPKTDVNAWNSNAALTELLPATLEGDAGRPIEAKDPVAWQDKRFDHPITTLWNDSAQGSLSAVRMSKYFRLKVKPELGDQSGAANPRLGGDPSVIARTGGNEPVAVEWPYGTGRVVVFGSTATPQWTNLPLHPAFVAVVQRLVGFLNRQQAARLVLRPGETFEVPVSMDLLGKDFSAVTPREKDRRVAGRIDVNNGKATLRFRDTSATGAYQLFLGDETTPLAVFGVQTDPAESDVRQMEKASVDAFAEGPKPGDAAATSTASTPSDRSAPTPSPAAATAAKPRYEVGREYWTLLIWVAAIVVIVETVLAHRFSRSL
ncbi:hypothetical protein DB346_24030 [Verrucomicrobia bacterium LW23]|nr:hypothetical protein DB346_24030 [Verrucomicrobia bacterium LW23]